MKNKAQSWGLSQLQLKELEERKSVWVDLTNDLYPYPVRVEQEPRSPPECLWYQEWWITGFYLTMHRRHVINAGKVQPSGVTDGMGINPYPFEFENWK